MTTEQIVSAIKEFRQHLPGLLNTPQKFVYAAINDLFRRAFGLRRLAEQFGVRTEQEIFSKLGYKDKAAMIAARNNVYFYLEPDFAKLVRENTRLLEEAFKSGPVELPSDVIPINRQIKTFGRNINIKGQGPDSIIRVYPNKWLNSGPDRTFGEGLDFNITTGKHACTLVDFKVEMAESFEFGSYITIAGFSIHLLTQDDPQLTRQNIVIENLHLNGSNAYQKDKPWSHGTQFGLKMYNPNYAKIEWVHAFGTGVRHGDGSLKNTCGIYIESSRGSYECLISSPKITEWHTLIKIKNPLVTLGNIPYGHEGMKIEKGSLVTGYDSVVIECDTYNSPGWHVVDCHMAFYRYGIKASGNQGFASKNLMYCFGHSDAGFAAFFYLSRAASDWTISDNKCYYQGGPLPTKDPYGVIIAGGYLDFVDRFEYAVAHNIHNNYFVGKPGTDKSVCWFQDGAINNAFHDNRREFYKQTISKTAQNKVYNNSPGELLDGGTLTRVLNEQVVITIPLLDANNDPVEPPQTRKVLTARGDEGVELVPYSGQRTASLVSSQGEIVLIKVLPPSQQGVYVPAPGEIVFYNADIAGHILDAQWTRGREITVRDYFVSSINQTDPNNPIEVYSLFEGQKIYGFAAAHGAIIRLKTQVRITLIHSDAMLPLPGGNDIVLMPGEYVEFENGRKGIQYLNRFSLPLALENKTELDEEDTLDAGRDYIVEDYIVPEIAPAWRVGIDRYKGNAGGIYERQTAKHLTLPYQIARHFDNATGLFTRWTRIDKAILEITDENTDLLPGQYYIFKTLYPGSPSWYLTEHRASETNSDYRAQTAISLVSTITIERRRDNGVWSAWTRTGNKIVSGPTAITNEQFAVGFDPQGKPQMWLKDENGATKKITQVDDYIPTVLRNPIDFELEAYNFYLERTQRLGVNDFAYILVHGTGSGLVEELKPLLKAYFDSLYVHAE